MHSDILIFHPVWNRQQVRPLGSHLAQIRIVHIQESLVRSPLDIVVQLPFRLHHSLERTEAEQVASSHIGYQTIIRQGNRHQFLYVPRMARPHLHYGNLCFRIDFQQGKRNADAVVEIAFCCRHTVFH